LSKRSRSSDRADRLVEALDRLVRDLLSPARSAAIEKKPSARLRLLLLVSISAGPLDRPLLLLASRKIGYVRGASRVRPYAPSGCRSRCTIPACARNLSFCRKAARRRDRSGPGSRRALAAGPGSTGCDPCGLLCSAGPRVAWAPSSGAAGRAPFARAVFAGARCASRLRRTHRARQNQRTRRMLAPMQFDGTGSAICICFGAETQAPTLFGRASPALVLAPLRLAGAMFPHRR